MGKKKKNIKGVQSMSSLRQKVETDGIEPEAIHRA